MLNINKLKIDFFDFHYFSKHLNIFFNKMIINETTQNWSQLIKEELGVENPQKLAWMSKYAQNHQVFEGLQQATPNGASAGIYATPLNTLGIGNPMMPVGTGFNTTDGSGIGNTGADFHNPLYKVGSGDIPMSTLPMSLEVAAITIGLELVPVIPANGPWQMLQYMDFPYAGGKLGRINETSLDGKGKGDENKPIYIKVSTDLADLTYVHNSKVFVQGTEIHFKGEDATLVGKYIGKSRIDNGIIVKVEKVVANDGAAEDTKSIADVFTGAVEVHSTEKGVKTFKAAKADLVATAADHVQGFANFFDGGDDPMTRAQNETGVGNTIGARFFTKMIQMGSYEVTGTVTRQQLQDMPLYGIDVVGKVLEAMQNQLSQNINNRILDRVFKLGVTNARMQKDYMGVDLNLYFAGAGDPDSKDLKDFAAAAKFVDIHGVNQAATWGAIKNATKNTAAENTWTHQRRIMSRVLAAANIITNVSRFGRPSWVVTNLQVLTALQDSANFVINPMVNTLTQDGSQSLYFAGSIAGLNIYVDPYMLWDDCRVCVGRKSNGQNPGVAFLPYILCDTVQIVAEGTMAPKLLVNSRFAIADLGFHPEQNYFTFMVDDTTGMIV